MDTYDDLERRIERQENSLLFALKRRLLGAEGIDADDAQSRRDAVADEYATVRDDAGAFADRVATALETPRETGRPLPDTFDVRPAEIDGRREAVASFRADNGAYLRGEEHERLESVAERLVDQAAYVRAKRAFDDELARVEPDVESLVADARPYLDYDAYLTEPDREELTAAAVAARDAVADAREAVDVGALAEGDRERLTDLESQVATVAERLTDYNSVFVERRREASADLFTDVDEAGHDLNPAQQKAVVRNGYFNKVVAGAGTGKTFALVYRVAYLVRQGVDPSRIVALTYTKEAAREMDDRLESSFGIAGVEVRTIHSFAYHIAQEATERNRSVAQTEDKYNLVDDVLREAEDGDGAFADHYLQFLYHYDDDFLDEADFHDKTDYVAQRRDQRYETLAGETVASEAEKVIADFLFTHGVTYQYESVAEWAETAADKGPYRPDFSLPEHDLYVEHWGIDENGEVAPWFTWSTEEYRGKMQWGRGEFERADARLVETYDFEHESGRLERALRHRLSAAGVELDRMAFDEFVDGVFEYNEKRGAIEDSFVEFVENAKTFDVSPDEIPERLTRSDPRQYHFGHCGRRVLEAYDAFLKRNDLIDFDDMIYDAIAAIEDDPGEYRRRYDHVLVDEFQDVAPSQLRLVRNFVGPEAGARLFCVGDDWQSIYSFQGSKVGYFVDFDEHVGPPEPVETHLTANYRCPATVIEASNALIANNDDQIDKTVEAHSGRDTDPVVHALDGYRDADYERRVGSYAANLVERFVDGGSDPSEIMVLCRYDGGAPYVDGLKEALRERGIPYDGKADHYRPRDMPGENDDDFDDEAGVAAFSVHQAKGREAKHVLVLHAVTGPMGFPPDERDDDLIAPVQDVETNTIAEERRLFYVALTRATHDLHVLTRVDRESPFVAEIEEFATRQTSLATPGEEGDRVTVTARVARLWDDVHESQRQAGVLEDPTGTTKFVSWESDDPPEVAADTWYKLEDLRVGEYKGDPQLVVDGSTNVVSLFEERPSEAGPTGATARTENAGEVAEANDGVAANGAGDTASASDAGDTGAAGEADDIAVANGAGAGATAAGTGPESEGDGEPPPAIAGGPNLDVSYGALAKETSPIGRGGDAVVYGAAADGGDGPYLAVKEPDQRETLHSDTVGRFLDEAETWQRLAAHDHVVDVVDWGSDPLPWIAMEYMDGGHLGERLGALPADQAIWTALAVTRAVRHAHNSGVRHHDLKPRNVLFRRVADPFWDVPKVADWGVAGPAVDAATDDGVTPAYAAPEQLFDGYDPDHHRVKFGVNCGRRRRLRARIRLSPT